MVSATTPVGTSKITIPAVKRALTTITWKMSSPASIKKRVLIPHMTDTESV